MDDRPGQLSKVAECLAEHAISLATVSQTPHGNNSPATLILTTHETNEHSVAQAMASLEELPGVLLPHDVGDGRDGHEPTYIEISGWKAGLTLDEYEFEPFLA